jgi:hypothetical protein
MAVRILLLFGFLILEIGAAIAILVGIATSYPFTPMDGPGIAGCVVTVAVALFLLLLTIAFFVRGRGTARAKNIVADARAQAARILAEATDKALALCSLEGGRCPKCGNPRTGKFCPKCGTPGNVDAPVTTAVRQPDPAPVSH